MKIKKVNGSYVYGDYVMSPCKNVWNNQNSYWLSKRGYTFALYAFTPIERRDLSQVGLKEHFDANIPRFEKEVSA